MAARPLPLTLNLLAFIHLVASASSPASSFHISPERIKSLRVEACTYERHSPARNEPSAAVYPLPSANKLKWCLTLHSNKDIVQLEEDLKRTTQLIPLVAASWRRLSSPEDAPECRVVFKGYQKEYRLAPGLGHYQGCQQYISRYEDLLSKTRNQSLSGPYINSFDECPLQELPTSFQAYRACDLLADHWYQLQLRSSIHAEINYNKQYRQFWFNHTQTFVFKPQASTRIEGSHRDWLNRVLTVKLSVHQCDASFLIEQDSNWLHNVTVLGYYQYRSQTDLPSVFRLGNQTVANTTLSADRSWLSGTFPLQKANETDRNQLCLNITSNGVHYTNDVLLCHHVPVAECSAPRGAALIALIIITLTALAFM